MQASSLLVFIVPFAWSLVVVWAASHFVRAIGLTLAFHRYFAHRAFELARPVRFVWAFIGTAAMQKGPIWWAGHHIAHDSYADREGDSTSYAIALMTWCGRAWDARPVPARIYAEARAGRGAAAIDRALP